MVYAPIIIPTLCREEHFKRCIESLKHNSWARHTEVFIGIDFPMTDEQRGGWDAICRYCDETDFSMFKAVHVFRRAENYGSYRNLNEMIEIALERYDRWIRTDDDCEFSPNFLEYMDRTLEAYESDEQVIAVTGYSYPLQWHVSEQATTLRQNFEASMWGTGFWARKRAYYYDYISSGQMLRDLPRVIKEGSYLRMTEKGKAEYIPVAFKGMMYNGVLLRCISDIALRAYVSIADRYVITPTLSKCRNHGFDGSGEFCHVIQVNTDKETTADNYNYSQQPIDLAEDFDLRPDTLNATEANRKLLSDFYPPLKYRQNTVKLLLLCSKIIGITCTKAIYSFLGFIANIIHLA